MMLSLSVEVSISSMETVRMRPENNDLGIGGTISSESAKDRCLYSLGVYTVLEGAGVRPVAGDRGTRVRGGGHAVFWKGGSSGEVLLGLLKRRDLTM